MGIKASSLTVHMLKYKESRASNENVKCFFYIEVLSEVYLQQQILIAEEFE